MKSLFKLVFISFCILLPVSVYGQAFPPEHRYPASVVCTNIPDTLRVVSAFNRGDVDYAVKLLTEDKNIKCITTTAAKVPFFPTIIKKLVAEEGKYEVYEAVLFPTNEKVYVYSNKDFVPET